MLVPSTLAARVAGIGCEIFSTSTAPTFSVPSWWSCDEFPTSCSLLETNSCTAFKHDICQEVNLIFSSLKTASSTASLSMSKKSCNCFFAQPAAGPDAGCGMGRPPGCGMFESSDDAKPITSATKCTKLCRVSADVFVQVHPLSGDVPVSSRSSVQVDSSSFSD